MNYKIILCSLCLISSFAVAQEMNSKFSLGGFISPNISYRTLKIADDYPITGLENIWNESENPKAGYSAGIIATYDVRKKISLQTGIGFSNNGYSTEKRSSWFLNQFNNNNFNPTIGGSTSPAAWSNFNNAFYLDIPILVKYKFLEKKVGLYVIGGMEANFFVAGNTIVTYYYNDGREEKEKIKTKIPRVFNISAVIGMGVDIKLNPKTTLFIQPTFRYMLVPISKDAIKTRFYSCGLNVGVAVSLPSKKSK